MYGVQAEYEVLLKSPYHFWQENVLIVLGGLGIWLSHWGSHSSRRSNVESQVDGLKGNEGLGCGDRYFARAFCAAADVACRKLVTQCGKNGCDFFFFFLASHLFVLLRDSRSW